MFDVLAGLLGLRSAYPALTSVQVHIVLAFALVSLVVLDTPRRLERKAELCIAGSLFEQVTLLCPRSMRVEVVHLAMMSLRLLPGLISVIAYSRAEFPRVPLVSFTLQALSASLDLLNHSVHMPAHCMYPPSAAPQETLEEALYYAAAA
jgi:hypothetical protein